MVEEQDELLNTGIGTKEKEKLKPAKITIAGIVVKRTDKEGKLMKTPLILLQCMHPDSDEPIQISKAKLEIGNKLQVTGLWANVDEDKNILKGSTLARVLEFLEASNLKDLEGKKAETVQESEDGYLCIKAY